MLCPLCKSENNRVLETRNHSYGELRRRRECLDCGVRFTTIETLMIKMPYVIKKDGSHEAFDVQKLRRSLQLACVKRPVSLPVIEDIVSRLVRIINNQATKELTAVDIGQYVMQELKKLDSVAYIRFASVYNSFGNVQEFVQTLEKDT